MAEIVIGIASSHSPMLNTGVDVWQQHAARDRHNDALRGRGGAIRSYDELVSAAPGDLERQLSAEVFQTKYAAMQAGIEACREKLENSGATVAVIIGNDHKELFGDDGMPAFAVYLGETITDIPNPAERLAAMPEGLRVGQWAYHGDEPEIYPVAAGLARHLVSTLMTAGFDPAQLTKQPAGRVMGHAWTFPRRRLMGEQPLIMVPVHLNTMYPPNQPSPARCYRFGQALADGIRSWPGAERVAIITSGGLSHFVVDEELDRRVLRALQANDVATIDALPAELLQDGSSEILNWITAAGALTDLHMTVIDYIAGYRSEAGTGVGVAYAAWQ